MDPRNGLEPSVVDIVAKSAIVEPRAKDALRINADEARDPRGWPEPGTVVKVIAIVIVVIVLVGWALTALNH
jgi:hypothetical protein